MDVGYLLKTLRDAGVTLDVRDVRLRVDAPQGAMTHELRQSIQAHKAAIIEAITGERHWTNPRTGQPFVTRLARCERCDFACWGPKPADPVTWACQVCAA